MTRLLEPAPRPPAARTRGVMEGKGAVVKTMHRSGGSSRGSRVPYERWSWILIVRHPLARQLRYPGQQRGDQEPTPGLKPVLCDVVVARRLAVEAPVDGGCGTLRAPTGPTIALDAVAPVRPRSTPFARCPRVRLPWTALRHSVVGEGRPFHGAKQSVIPPCFVPNRDAAWLEGSVG